jgi:RNA polymerase sigma-B factor
VDAHRSDETDRDLSAPPALAAPIHAEEGFVSQSSSINGGKTPREGRYGNADQTFLEHQLRDGGPRARDAIVTHYLPLARRLAGRYRSSSECRDDLEQVACLGLVKAIDRYEIERGPFVRYAIPTILGELRRHFRDTGWAMHVPRSLQERVLKIGEARDRFAARSGRQPTIRELAEAVGLSVEDVLEALDAGNVYALTPLDARVPAEEGEGRSLGDSIGVLDEHFEAVERRAAVKPLLRTLPDRERTILKLHFFDDMTQVEIAERIGCSQMHVSRLLRRSLGRLNEMGRASGAAA